MSSYQRIKDEGGGIKKYFINRAKRILPQYYLILAVDYVASFLRYHAIGVSWQQIFEPMHGACGIQYLKYFAFLQYILPSENFDLWNNRYALWTMSSFAFFYFLVPFIYRFVNSFNKSLVIAVILLLCRSWMVSLSIRLIGLMGLFSQIDSVAEGEPINTLCYFMIGVLIWHSKTIQKRHAIGLLGLTIAALSPMGFPRIYIMVFGAMLIMAIEFPINEYIGFKGNEIIKDLSAATFFIYLVHPVIVDSITNLVSRHLGGGTRVVCI